MTATECIDAYRRFSVLAEQHFSQGDDRAGAEMLYGALTQIIIAIALGRRAEFREHQHRRRVVRALTTELNDSGIGKAFAAAQRLHVHFYLNNLAGDDLVEDISDTHTLINRLLPLTS